MKIVYLLLFTSMFSHITFGQDSAFIRVHFLYGSVPMPEHRDTEPKWFGGILGGHVGIEGDNNQILNFVPKGSFHVIAKKENRHSAFALHDYKSFYSILGGNADSVKKAIVYIPISFKQKQTFDSLATIYLEQTPYDYALVGMRCGSAAYDILSKLQILPALTCSKTYSKIFYPKKLRERLFKIASSNAWVIERYSGSSNRKWESD